MTLPGQFFGGRLRTIRMARGLSGASLAERLGVSGGSITQWEQGATSPRPDRLKHLAEVLRVPEQYFFRVPAAGFTYPKFRSLMTTPARSRDEAEARAQMFGELCARLEKFVRWPAFECYTAPCRGGFRALTTEDIERAAEATRSAWGLGHGPIPNLTRLLESRGVAIAKFPFSISKIEALSMMSGERPVIALNSDSASAVRLRFDLAHELGHFVLHRDVERATFRQPQAYKELETQAHQFAGAFLFPARSFQVEFRSTSPQALIELKRRWGLSIQAIVLLASRRGYITSDRYGQLFRLIGRRGWRNREPLDDLTAAERPSMVYQSVQKLLTRFTLDQLLFEVGLHQEDLEAFSGVPAGTFTRGEPMTVTFKTATASGNGRPVGSERAGNVIQFPGPGK